MPNFIIHQVANSILLAGFYWYEQNIKKHVFNWKNVCVQLLLASLIDLDHLSANPIYDPARCSINFHLLHSWYVWPVYVAGLFSKKYKYFFAAIIVHLILDYFDCFV